MPAFNPANSDAGRNQAARKKREAAKPKPKPKPNVSPYGGVANPPPSTPATRQRAATPYGSTAAPKSARVQKIPGPLEQIGDAIKGSRYIGPAIKEIGDALAPVNPVPPAKAQQTSPTKRPSPQEVLGKLWNDTSSTTKRALVETTKDALGRDLLAPLVFGSSVRGTQNYSGRQLGQGLVSAATSTATWLYSTTTKDVDSGPIGQLLNQLPNALNPLFGGKPPSEMTPQELDAFRMKGSLAGNLILSRVNPFAGAMTRATNIGQFSVSAGRAAAFQEIGSAVVTDPRGGNAIDFVNAVSGTNLPGGVTANDSYFEASIKSIPGDALFGYGLGRAGGAAVGVTLKGAQLTLNAAGVPLNAVKKRVARTRAAKAEQRERAWQEANGFTTKDPESGAHDFSPEFKQPKPKTPAPAETAPADTAVDAPANTADIDPTLYDPALPTSTTLGNAINNLPDPELYALSRGTGPIADRVEQALRKKEGLDTEASPTAPPDGPPTAPPDGPPMVAAGTELWHGTSPKAGASIKAGGFKPSKIGVIGGGTYFTTNPRYAGGYGEVAITGGLPEGAKVLDLVAQKKSFNDFAKEIGVGEPADLVEDMRLFSREQQAAIKKWAEDNDIDGIQFDPVTEDIPGAGTPELVLFNRDAANLIAGAPIDRDGIKAKLLREAITNGEVRPPDAQIPDLPEPRVDLGKVDFDKPVTPGSPEAQALAEEIRLTAQDMAEQDAINLAAKQAMREAEGYDLKTFDEKKAEGLLEGYSKAEEDEVLRQLDEAAKAYGESIDKGLELASDMRRLADEIDTGEANARAELSEWVQPTPPERPTPVRLSNSLGDQPAFSLPAELSKAAPRYGSRQVRFASDLDRAAYILLADAKKGTSKAAAKFREALVEQGLDPGAVAEHGLRVKAALRNSTPSGDGVIDLPAQGWGGNNRPEVGSQFAMNETDALSLNPRLWDVVMEARGLELKQLENAIIQDLREIAGDDVAIRIHHTYKVVSDMSQGAHGLKGEGSIGGLYQLSEDVINVWTETSKDHYNFPRGTDPDALTKNLVSSPEHVIRKGYHEALHRIIDIVLDDRELKTIGTWISAMRIQLLGNKLLPESYLTVGSLNEAVVDFGSHYMFLSRQGYDPVKVMIETLANNNARTSPALLKKLAYNYTKTVVPILNKVLESTERLYNRLHGRGAVSLFDTYDRAAAGGYKNAISEVVPDGSSPSPNPPVPGARIPEWSDAKAYTRRRERIIYTQHTKAGPLARRTDNVRKYLKDGLWTQADVKDMVKIWRGSDVVTVDRSSEVLGEARSALLERLDQMRKQASKGGCI